VWLEGVNARGSRPHEGGFAKNLPTYQSKVLSILLSAHFLPRQAHHAGLALPPREHPVCLLCLVI